MFGVIHWCLAGLVLLVSVELTLQKVTECDEGETLVPCGEGEDMTKICVASDMTTSELIGCIAANDCNATYKIDTCDICAQNPDQYDGGSQYKDCRGRCFTKETKADMTTVDVCNVCGGEGTTCNPVVMGTDVLLVSSTKPTELTLSGERFLTPDVQIVIYEYVPRDRRDVHTEPERDRRDVHTESENRIRDRRETTVLYVAEIIRVHNVSTMEIRVLPGLTKGFHIISARAGSDGIEYEDNPGAKLYVYSEQDFNISTITPSEGDITEKPSHPIVSIVVDLEDADVFYILPGRGNRREIYCILSDYEDGRTDGAEIQEEVSALLQRGGNMRVIVELEMPSDSKQIWMCPSLNGQLSVVCGSFIFYQAAPYIVDDEAVFSANGDSLAITFNMPIALTPASDYTCSDIFTNVTSLGVRPTCRLNALKTVLTVRTGDSPTIKPDDTLEVIAGITAATGSYSREMEATEITVVRNTVTPTEGEEQPGEVTTPTSSLEVLPRGYWPTELTACASSPITLGISIGQSASGRQPDSIVWVVNDEVQEAASNKLELDVDVTSPRIYLINVKVTDFLGLSTSFDHTVNKTALPMPSVTFAPQRLTPISPTLFSVHPKTIFAIGTQIQYSQCSDGTGDTLDSFHFNWTRDDQAVEGHFFYKSSDTENTIEMCSTVVRYALAVIRKDNADMSVTTSIDIKIVCRDPWAIIVGSRVNELSITYPDRVPINGQSSRDLDGGVLSYSWTCLVNQNDCLETLGLVSSRTSAVLLLKPATLSVGLTHSFTLTVSVNKSDGVYTASSTVQYIGAGGALPTVQIITLEHNFRSNVRILMKANITLPGEGNNITTQWRLVPDLEEYEWLNLSREDVGKSNSVSGYTWYTIFPNILTAGNRYKIQVRVTLNGVAELTTTQDHDIYIYQALRQCQLVARDITELQQTTLTLQNCITDSAASSSLETRCKLGNTHLPNTGDLTFIVPILKNRTISSGTFICQVRDSLGHELTVESNEITITLLSDETLNAALEERVIEEASKDNIIDTLELRASKIAKEGQNSGIEDQKEVVKLMKRVRENQPSARDLKRAIRSAMVVEPDKLADDDVTTAVTELSQMVDSLSKEDVTEDGARLTQTEVQETLSLARKLVKAKKVERRVYRNIVESLAALRMKEMKNDEKEVIQLEDGATQILTVLTLDDVPEVLQHVTFPEDLKARFFGLWQCTPDEVCDDVGVKQEIYPVDPPDLQTGRTDKICAQFVKLDLYNPKTGESIDVIDNPEDIELWIPSLCENPESYYYQETTDRFSTFGLKVGPKTIPNHVHMRTNHFTMFTVRSGPLVSTARNIPLLMAAVVGSILCTICLFMLLKAWCLIKIETLHREIAEEKRLDELDRVYYNKAFDGY